MAVGNFLRCHGVTAAWEGGWSDHPADPGGATMYGITLAKFREHHPKATAAELRRISRSQALDIYRKDFWTSLGCEGLAAGVDLATYDAGVNSGPGRARKWLAVSAGGTPAETVKRLCARRLTFVRGLGTWKTFGKGWARRIADIEAKGVAWAITAASGRKAARQTLLNEEAGAGRQAARHGASAGTAGAGAGGTATLVDPSAADQLAGGSIIALLVVLGLVCLFFLWRMRVHGARKAAYRAEAMALSTGA